MEKKFIDYGERINTALLQVVKEILSDLSESRISSDHCFYITFNTMNDSVIMNKKLKKEYPSEMTIILQNQFWDLSVKDDCFDVTLSFNRKKENLSIPFNSIKKFNDPFVKFNLELDIKSKNKNNKLSNKKKLGINQYTSNDNVVLLDKFRKNRD